MLSSFLSKNILEKRLLVSTGSKVMEYIVHTCTTRTKEHWSCSSPSRGRFKSPSFLERHNNGKRKSANPYFLPLTFVLLFLQI